MVKSQFNEDEVATARVASDDAGLDFLQRVPFEPLYLDLIRHACSTVELATGRHGKRAVAALLQSLPIASPPKGEASAEFDRRLNEGDASLLEDYELVEFDWQDIASNLIVLFFFAWHGQNSLPDRQEARREIERTLEHFRRLVADPGVRAIVSSGFEWFTDTLAAAEARWSLDNGLAVIPDSLAALAGVKPKTLANLIAAGQIPTDDDGRVSGPEALQYLSRRKTFVRSSWQDPIEEPAPDPGSGGANLPEQIFVPVDSDGSPFLPSSARRGRDGQFRYILGEKASPIYVDEYWEALDKLARMSVPRWRRPAAGAGGWSLVNAQEGWRRFARSDIQRMIEALSST